jgi:RND family efflux transporter MFP subunit
MSGKLEPDTKDCYRGLIMFALRQHTSKRVLIKGAFVVACLGLLASCGRDDVARAGDPTATEAPTVAVTKVTRRPLARSLTLSSELVPFQEIDVYAKESGFVSKLYVDYGSHVKKNQVLAVLEIPELEALLHEDEANIKAMTDQVTNAAHELRRVEATHRVLHLEYQRINGVATSKPGLVAQQEVDDVQGKDLAAEAQVEAAKSRLQAAQSQLALAQSKLAHDEALYNYSKITAPFDGVVTQRYANYGTLMQAGTSSSTNVLPLVRLSEEDLYRLVIPVPESYVRYIRIGDPVVVSVPALDQTFPGRVARFSFDVTDATRTMHTEVDVPNPTGVLMPGMYANATLTLDRKGSALAVPLEAVQQENDRATVWVLCPGDKVQNRQITLGVQTENYAEVTSGLKDGDEVVTSDRSGLKDGETVHPKLTELPVYNGQS